MAKQTQNDSRIKPEASPLRESFGVRLHRALGPIAGGLILDFVDLATFGPFGIYGGFIFGGLIGWWISSIYEFQIRGRLIFAFLAAFYLFVPFTEVIPVATIISAFARFQTRRGNKEEDK